ncbi:MAG: DUF3369 domain-containing protein, partial [Nitrospinae bacterium]|nr:DUF3369 domain-containing protein [Nitrospinota bacterium]
LLLLKSQKGKELVSKNSCIIKKEENNFLLQTGQGIYANVPNHKFSDVATPELLESVTQCLDKHENHYDKNLLITCLPGCKDIIILLHFDEEVELCDWNKKLINVYLSKVSAAYKNLLLFEKNNKTQEAAILSLAKLAEYKDNETGDHIKRVEKMAIAVAKRLFEKGAFKDIVNETFVKHIGIASILHDVGKVGISDRILLKPSKLTDEEYELVKMHTIIGGAILADASEMISGKNYLSMAAEIAECHHEQFAGGGYPHSLKQDSIPVSARIIAVVDVYDALTSKRPYKEPWPIEKAIAILEDSKGTQFDPVVVDAFLELLREKSE